MQVKNLVFIDSRVKNYQALIDDLPLDFQYYLLSPTLDGVKQIADILAEYIDLDAVHILSHGSPGTLYLGNSALSSSSLSLYEDSLSVLGASLSETGDLLLYGCNVAQEETGQTFLAQLSAYTDADVAASDDLYGVGGDLSLEVHTGQVDAISLQGDYDFTLGTIEGTAGYDFLSGTDSDDIILAHESDDVISGTSGNDVLIGGDGHDIVVYDDLYANFSLLSGCNLQKPDGVDSLYKIETLQFNDAKISLKLQPVTEFKVNTYTDNSQYGSSVAALPDGGWIISWQSYGQDGSYDGIYAQRYAADGLSVGEEFQVNTYTNSNQSIPSVAALLDGGWIISWQSDDQDGDNRGIYAQRYAADGSSVGDEFQVNTYTNSLQSTPSVAALPDGGWIISWQSYGQDGHDYGIYAQRYAADGSTDGDEFQVNTVTNSSQSTPSAATLPDGGWIITWQSYDQDGDDNGIYAQRYAADGSNDGNEFQVNTYTDSLQSTPSVAALPDGGWIICWQSFDQDGNAYGIYAQRYAADGSTDGNEFQVNTYTDNYQYSSSVAALPDGGWVISWQSDGQDGDDNGIYAQRYAADGSTDGNEFQVNTYTNGSQSTPSAAALPDGGWIISWTSSGQDGSYYSIYAQRYCLDGTVAQNLIEVEVTGDESDQQLSGYSGSDTISALAGDDIIYSSAGDDFLDGGTGIDWVSYSSYLNGVNVDLTLGAGTVLDATAAESLGTDDLLNIENILGSDFDDLLRGNTGANTLSGGAGADTLTGGYGIDTFLYETASDSPQSDYDTITDYTAGEFIQFAGIAGFSYTPDADLAGTSIALAIYQIQNDASFDNTIVFLEDGTDGFLYVNGEGSGTNFDRTFIKLEGHTQAPTLDQINFSPYGSFTISGNPTQNQTLTADTSALYDADGIGVFTYQWLRDGAAITGATHQTYQLEQADVSTRISVRVSYTDGQGTEESLTSAETTAIANVDDEASGVINVTGTALEGGSLSVTLTEIVDVDGGTTTDFFWQMYESSSWSDISGATTATLSIPADQSYVNTRVRAVGVTTDALDGTTTFYSDAQTIQNVDDAPTGLPSLTGENTQGQTLTVNTSEIADAEGISSFSYQWSRNGVSIDGAVGSSYELTQDDVGTLVSVAVQSLDSFGGTGSWYLTGSSVVANINDAPEGAPAILGTATQGETLTVDTSAIYDADDLGSFSFQWLRDGVTIPGAIYDSYTLEQSDVNAKISIAVSYTDAYGTAEDIASAETAAVANVDDEATGILSFSGSAEEGGTFTATLSSVVDIDGETTTSYQWQQSSDGASGWNNINGAASSLYIVPDDQTLVDQYLRVIATSIDELGGTTTFTSNPSAQIANINDMPTGTVTIVGAPAQGALLTSSIAMLNDPEGIGPLSYQWLRDGVAIAGATGATYAQTQDDVGSRISVHVSYIDYYGSVESVTSAETIAVVNVDDEATGVLGITGTAQEGGTLAAVLTNVTDLDGATTTAYQWQVSTTGASGWSNLSVATNATYLIADDQSLVGKYLRVVATTTDTLGGTTTFTSDATVAIANVNDAPVVAQELADQHATQDSAYSFAIPAATFSDVDSDGLSLNAIMDDGSQLPAWLSFDPHTATFSGTPTNADVGVLNITVTADDGDASVSDTFTLSIANVDDAASAELRVTGAAEEGGSLSASLSNVSDPDGAVTIAYVWQVDTGNGWEDISGATEAFISIPSDQSYVGNAVRVVATTTDELGGNTSFTSAAVVIANVNDAPEGTVTLSGAALQKETLMADTSALVDADGLGAFSYQWLRGGVNIEGATAASYTLSQDDFGAQVSVSVSYTDGYGMLETITSESTAAVGNEDEEATATLSVSGTAEEGGSMSATLLDISDPNGETTTAWQWQISENDSSGWSDIKGATSSTHAIADDQSEVGQYLRVVATTTDEVGGTTTFAGDAVLIANVNDAPTLQPPASITYTDTSEQDTFLEASGALVATDADGDSLTYGIADGIDQGEGFVSLGGTYGSLTVNTATGAYAYIHNNSAIQALSSNATETFVLSVTDGNATTQAQLDIDIVAVNDIPQANSDSATTEQDTAVVISALANDTDAENDTLSITSTTDPSHGSVSISEDNQILYTTEADYSGTDSFDYTISDGNGGTDTATVNVTVEEVEDDNTYFCYSEEFYLLNNPDVAAAVSSGAFANGWEHYSNYGYLEGRSFAQPDGYGDFSEKFYLLNNPDVAAAVEAGAFINGWEHYSGFGQAEGRSYAAPEGYGDFSEEFYLLNNPDVAAAVAAGSLSSGWYHYSNFGEAEERSYAMPEGYGEFNEEFYLLNNPDVAAAVEADYLSSGWYHYINFGQAEERSYAMPEEYGDFSEEVYLLNNPDVAAAVAAGTIINGWEHYSEFGQDEGRSYKYPEILLQSVSCTQESQALEQAMIYMASDCMADDDTVELLGLADDVMDDLPGA